jgi:hypothetical protein
MKSALKTILLAGTAALAIQLGAFAAHAGDLDDLLDAQQAAAALDSMSGGDSDPIGDAVEAAATEAVVDTLLGAGDDD